MTARAAWYRGLASTALLGAFLILPALSVASEALALLLVVVGVAAGAGLRASADPWLRGVAPVGPLVAIGGLAVSVPPGAVSELLLGVAVVLFLVWLADDPRRLARGALRAVPTVAIAGLVTVLAWGSAVVLPPTAAPLGVAAALLLAVVALVSLLIARPELIAAEEEAAAS